MLSQARYRKSANKRLWAAADQFRANSGLKSQEYSAPVLGLIFLRFAAVRFAAKRAKLEKSAASSRRGSRLDEPAAYHAEGVLYLPAEARFDYLLNRLEAENTAYPFVFSGAENVIRDVLFG